MSTTRSGRSDGPSRAGIDSVGGAADGIVRRLVEPAPLVARQQAPGRGIKAVHLAAVVHRDPADVAGRERLAMATGSRPVPCTTTQAVAPGGEDCFGPSTVARPQRGEFAGEARVGQGRNGDGRAQTYPAAVSVFSTACRPATALDSGDGPGRGRGRRSGSARRRR